MGNLLIRRREMILTAGEPVGPLLYSLENRTVVDGEVIDTGVAPLRAGENMTILFDMTVTKNPTSKEESCYYFLLFVNSRTYFSVRKPGQWNNQIRTVAFNTSDDDNNCQIMTTAAGRKRIVITHEANTNQVTAIGKQNAGTATVKTVIGRDAFSPTTETLKIGAPGTRQGLPPGTINLAQVYNTILSQEEIDAFLA